MIFAFIKIINNLLLKVWNVWKYYVSTKNVWIIPSFHHLPSLIIIFTIMCFRHYFDKYPSRATNYDNVKMTLKWIGNDWKTDLTFNDDFGHHFNII